MRLRLSDLLRRLTPRRGGLRLAGHARMTDSAPREAVRPEPEAPEAPEAAGRHRRGTGARGYERGYDGAGIGVSAALQPPAGLRPRIPPPSGGGVGRARIREAPFAEAQYGTEARYGTAPVGSQAAPAAARPASAQSVRQPWYQVVTGPPPARGAAARQRGLAALGQPAQVQARPAAPPAPGASRSRLPFAAPHPLGHPPTADGRRNCGPLEKILHRQWDADTVLPAQVITAIDRLAEFPARLKAKLADGLDGIYIGPGGVPELDDMGALRGVRLPSGRATWDACAGAYGERKIVVGSRSSPTPDVMCHEVGHALDDLDSPQGKWQSDSAEFRAVYDLCTPHIISDFHRQRGGLGRKEFFADAFAAIASGQRPALVDMLGGDTRTALRVMLFFNRRYGI